MIFSEEMGVGGVERGLQGNRIKLITQPHKVLFQFWQDSPLNCFYNDLKTVGKDMTGQTKSAV